MKVGFAGSGNMAGAIARGWHLSGGPEAMLFTDSGSGRAQALADETGGERLASLDELAAASEMIVLAVKPAALETASHALAGFQGPVVSVLGATTLADLNVALPQASVLRTMPNVGVEIAQGVVCHAPLQDPAELASTLELLARIATLYELPEDQLDAATTVMGCSPAWLTVATEATAAAGAAAGLDPEIAKQLIARTTAVTGELLLRHEAAEIRRIVASPGGSTKAGLDALAAEDAAAAYEGAVGAALERMEGKR